MFNGTDIYRRQHRFSDGDRTDWEAEEDSDRCGFRPEALLTEPGAADPDRQRLYVAPRGHQAPDLRTELVARCEANERGPVVAHQRNTYTMEDVNLFKLNAMGGRERPTGRSNWFSAASANTAFFWQVHVVYIYVIYVITFYWEVIEF